MARTAPSVLQDANATTFTSATPTSLAVTLSSGATAGNLIMMGISSDGTFTSPAAGWTQLGSVVGSEQLSVWYRIAVGGETTWTLTISGVTCAWVGEIQNVDGSTPIDVATTAFTSTTAIGTTYAGPTSGSATVPEVLAVAVFATSKAGAAANPTTASNSFAAASHSPTSTAVSGGTATNVGIGVFTLSPNATGTRVTTATFSVTGTAPAAGIVILRGKSSATATVSPITAPGLAAISAANF